MADTELFNRQVRVTVDTIEIKALDVSFTVSKSLKPEPNKAELTIVNLNPSHRSQLEHLKTAPVLLEAGYEEGLTTLFHGDLRTAISVFEGPNVLTKLHTGDGEKAIRKSRLNVSFKKDKTNPKDVLKTIADSLGVGKGNLDSFLKSFSPANNPYSQGVVLQGSSFQEMTAFCRSFNLEWSVQDGNMQILESKKPLQNKAIELSADTGMIGSPTVDNDGVLTVTVLLAPDVLPGRIISLKSKRLQGDYRIESCQYSGDTSAQNWYIQIEAKRY